jgi:hypothetical protein
MPAAVYKAEIGFQTYNPVLASNICLPGTSYKWQVDYNTGQGALYSGTTQVRSLPTPGMSGRSTVLGNTVLGYNPQTGTFTGSKNSLNPLLGMYYWWVK